MVALQDFVYRLKSQNYTLNKIIIVPYETTAEKKVPCETTVEDVSFQWSHHRISFTDPKLRTTLQDSIIHSGSERVHCFPRASFGDNGQNYSTQSRPTTPLVECLFVPLSHHKQMISHLNCLLSYSEKQERDLNVLVNFFDNSSFMCYTE